MKAIKIKPPVRFRDMKKEVDNFLERITELRKEIENQKEPDSQEEPAELVALGVDLRPLAAEQEREKIRQEKKDIYFAKAIIAFDEVEQIACYLRTLVSKLEQTNRLLRRVWLPIISIVVVILAGPGWDILKILFCKAFSINFFCH